MLALLLNIVFNVVCYAESGLEVGVDWLLHHPKKFEHPMFELTPIQGDLSEFNKLINIELSTTYKSFDGESTDALEHYFYGMENGISMELGAVGGDKSTGSQTVVFDSLKWGRILIEGNVEYREHLMKLTETCAVSAAICKEAGMVHYVSHKYFSGIVEFMSESFIKSFHSKSIHNKLYPSHLNGTTHQPDYSLIDHVHGVHLIPCIPLSTVLEHANVSHVNFFILDVEGGELDVLHTIDWETTVFDVLVVETEAKFRPKGYFEKVNDFLMKRGYVCDMPVLGRNSWFRHKTFVPSIRPGIKKDCYMGAFKRNQANKTAYC